MKTRFIQSIHEVSAEQWDALWPTQYPFTNHGFFHALEASNSIDTGDKKPETGWQTQHLLVEKGDTLIAAMPLFIKWHSYGEYVFDWSWANAYHQAGLEYYPKLLNAIPFTPATGPRLGIHSSLSEDEKAACKKIIFDTLDNFAEQIKSSGFHSLFPKPDNFFLHEKYQRRTGYQYHWFNQGYKDFDDFLASFSSRKRKNLKKERQKVASHGFNIRMRSAEELSKEDWDNFYTLYHCTYLKRSGHAGYLGPSFFHLLAEAFPQQVLLASAENDGQCVAAAFYMRDEDTLYGRYWGALEEFDGLHFECCYYQGIEYAIQHKLKRFDPGAQGEHKIQRGFTPIRTQSYHWLTHPQFNYAVGGFLQEEKEHVDMYLQEAREKLPFKDDAPQIPEDILL